QQVLPHMRRRGGGTIVNISSLAGLVPAAGQAAYASSKWALEGLSETLALEVARFGIRVAIVEPGVVKTPILSKYTMPAATTGEYEDIYQRSMSFYLEGATEASGPDEVALTVLEAATTDSPRLRWTCGWGVDFNLRARESLGADGLLQQFATLDDAEFRRLLGEFGEPEADVDV
ncbi:MAG: SDR family NAD(P)-dependent oxidoreductase, partial [Actinomycetota bacterium]